jgi:tripartite-type tricarboxylate transporter receptor subunit TctC
MTLFRSTLIAACAALAFGANANAQDYPNKPIRLIVGYAPGGAVDIVSRIIAEPLGQRLGQRFIVDNRPGGGTIIALTQLAKADPDGYTMMMSDIAMSAAPALNKSLPFDTLKDFEPVVLVALLPGVMAVDKALPVKNVADFVKLAKSEPGKLNYASSGLGSLGHLGSELFKKETGTDIVTIPYQSGAQVMQALLGNNVQMFFSTVPPVLPFADKVNILAISHDKRLPALPDVPTFKEAGLPGVKIALWQGLFVPKGTDKKIIAKLNAEVNAVLKMPDVRERIEKLGADLVGGTPQDLAVFLKSEVDTWTKVIPASMRN